MGETLSGVILVVDVGVRGLVRRYKTITRATTYKHTESKIINFYLN